MNRRHSTLALALLLLAPTASPGSEPLETTVSSIRVEDYSTPAATRTLIEQRIGDAAQAGARFILLPEYALTGPARERSAQAIAAEAIPGPATRFLARLSRKHGVWIIAGVPELDGKGGFHSSALSISPTGKVEQIHRKVIVRSDKEDGSATRGNFRAIQDTIDANGIRIGIMPGDDVRIGIPRLAERGADIVFVPAIWPATEAEEWSELCRSLASEYNIAVVVADRTNTPGRVYYGGKAPVLGRGPVLIASIPIRRDAWSPTSGLGLPPTIPERRFDAAGPELVELGRKLFFDKNLSSTGTVSCASCHDPDKGYTNGRPKGVGVHDRQTKRNVPTLFNVAFRPVLQWDGYATSIENFTKYPITNTSEMNFHYLDDVPKYINSKPEYVQAFRKLLGVTQVEFPHVAKALASFERTLISANSPFDRYYYGGEQQALSLSAKRGLELFQGKAACATCHTIGDRYALFLDFKYHVVGVGYQPETGRFSDIGLAGISTDDQKGLFHTPSLRDVARTAPYMHDGSIATLEGVVEFYNAGGIPNPQLDPAIKPLRLTTQEKRDLVSFLESLTGGQTKPVQVAYESK